MVLVVLFAFVGASIGSFLCVVVERVPKGESIGGRSHCTCGRQLTWWENIPIVSWLALRGRARCCGAKLPIRYLLFELGMAGLFAVVAVVVLAQA